MPFPLSLSLSLSLFLSPDDFTCAAHAARWRPRRASAPAAAATHAQHTNCTRLARVSFNGRLWTQKGHRRRRASWHGSGATHAHTHTHTNTHTHTHTHTLANQAAGRLMNSGRLYAAPFRLRHSSPSGTRKAAGGGGGGGGGAVTCWPGDDGALGVHGADPHGGARERETETEREMRKTTMEILRDLATSAAAPSLPWPRRR